MQHDSAPTITLNATHAVVTYPRRRGTEVAEILGRVPGKDGEPDRIYLRTRLHEHDGESFDEVGAGRWSATGAISTVLVAEPSERRALTSL